MAGSSQGYNREITLADAEEMLGHIDSDSLDYESWAKLGRSLASEFGDSARDAFITWNSPAGEKEKTRLLEQWKEFLKSHSYSIGTLIMEAKSRGWSSKDSRELSAEERTEIKKQAEQRRKDAAQRAQAAEKEAAHELKRVELRFRNLPLYTGTESLYLQRKGIANAHQFTELRVGKDSHNNETWVAWPLLNESGEFKGYERLYDSVDGNGKNIKRVAKGSKPSKGWLTLGDLSTAKRAFVVGGFADAISALISTDEVIVSVVGEGNIPAVIKQLNEAYPHCEFIAAPDNDEAGLKAAHTAGGFWTVPATNGDDWNDVHQKHGPAEVKHQLLNFVRGFKLNQVHQRYLSIKIQEGLNLIQSAKETGKSYSTAEFIKANPHLKTLIISYRVLLNQSLAKQFDADFYQDLTIAGDHSLLKSSNRLVITPDSLWKIAGTRWDLVFVDEGEQTLQHFNSTTMENKTFNLDVFAYCLKSSKIQIIADADMSDLTRDFCSQIGLQSGVFHQNTYQPRRDSTIYLYEHPEHLKRLYTDNICNGSKAFYCSNTKKNVIDLAQRLENRGVVDGIAHVTSLNSDKPEIADLIKNINQVAPDLRSLLGSPSIGTGVSIDKHEFQYTTAHFSHRTGTASQAHQQLARARGITDYHIYVDPTERSDITNVDEIRRLHLSEPTRETAHFLNLDTEGQVQSHELFEWLYCHLKSIEADNRNHFKELFLQQAEAEGYTVVVVAEDELLAEAGKIDGTEAREILDEELKADIQAAQVLTDDQFDAAMRGEGDYSASEVLKSQVYRDFNFAEADPETMETELNELAFAEARDGYGRTLKKLGLAALPPEITKLMDIRNRKHATTLADHKHYSKKKNQLNKILAAAGLDEDLEYDGTVWNADVIQNLRKWLLRSKEALYKYSGVSVDFNALRNPLRWFNQFLRNLGIPVVSRQHRVGGQRVYSYYIDRGMLEGLRTVIQRRNKGIVEYYQGPDMDSESVMSAADDYYKNLAACMTPESTLEPSISGSLGNSEEGKEAQEFSVFKVSTSPASDFEFGLVEHFYSAAQASSGLSREEVKAWIGAENSAALESGEISYNRVQSLIWELRTESRRVS